MVSRKHAGLDVTHILDSILRIRRRLYKQIRLSPLVEILLLPSELADYVRDIEFDWIKTNIVRCLFPYPNNLDFGDRHRFILNSPLSRPEILRYLRKIVHISWIRDFLLQFIERYTQKEKEWLQGLEDFKREVKLAQVRELTDNNQS